MGSQLVSCCCRQDQPQERTILSKPDVKAEFEAIEVIQKQVDDNYNQLDLEPPKRTTLGDNFLSVPGLTKSPSFQSTSSDQRSGSFAMEKNYTLNDFLVEKVIGQGNFGVVNLVKRLSNNKIYAMKQIKKSDILKANMIASAIYERNILKLAKHPFLIDLKCSFQTDSKLYYIMEYIPNGELYELQRRLKRFSLKESAFIISEVILAVEFLHSELSVLYRDLKPENILLTDKGHIKLSDFGLSKRLNSDDELTYTYAGTVEYLAPEVVTGKGHNRLADFWSIGVLLYELIAGKPPFHDENRNPERIESLIMLNQPIFYNEMGDDAIHLIKSLLQHEPQKRLGAQGFQQLKKHPFFKGSNWDNIVKLKVKSPLKQYLKSEGEVPTSQLEFKRSIIEIETLKSVDQTEQKFHLEGFSYEEKHYLEEPKTKPKRPFIF